jgi:hypothetical protein
MIAGVRRRRQTRNGRLATCPSRGTSSSPS